MLGVLRSPSFLPSCIMAGVGILFLVLVFTLPPQQTFALASGSAVALGLVCARLRREAVESEPTLPAVTSRN